MVNYSLLTITMKLSMRIYNQIKQVVEKFSKILQFATLQKTTGRKLAISIIDSISLGLYKQRHHIATKKSIYEMFAPNCSYKTLVVNLNRWTWLAATVLALLLKQNQSRQHPIKHIDSTDIPVCKFKNAKGHRTMKSIAMFSRSKRKQTFFGLKLHLLSDYNRNLLALRFTPGNVDDRKPVPDMVTDDIWGIVVADAGYISNKLRDMLYQPNKRIFLFQPRRNMKQLTVEWQQKVMATRMLIELNFRNLKLFYGLITSLPRSVAGYCANYIYSLLAYAIA